MTEDSRPRVLIEDWFPAVEFGIESRREAAPIPGQFPKLKTIHVWWARRPLVASAGAVLGSLMPAWSSELAAAFPDAPELETEEAYRGWFLRLCGVLGDPIEGRKRLDLANAQGIKLKGNGYGYKQAFKNSPDSNDVNLLGRVLTRPWGRNPLVCDPTAGGGSIPYEAVRYGLATISNDLNPVAAAILRAAVEAPARFGRGLTPDLRRFGGLLCERIQERLAPYFALQDSHERVVGYIHARTVACPRTGKPVPLAPSWWLRRGKDAVAVRLVTERDKQELAEPEFEILERSAIAFDPSEGTVSGGTGVSPWDGLAIDGDYIKAEARAGRMGSILYAVAIRTAKGRGFRAPTKTDLEVLAAAERALERVSPEWEADDVLPTEEVPIGNDMRPHHYGMSRWRDMFSPRQLLVHGVFVEELRKLIPEVREELGDERGDALLTELALMQGKAVNWNAYLSSWDVSRQKLRSVFDRHDYAFKSTFAEFDCARELYSWCLDQIVDAYESIARLLVPSDIAKIADSPSQNGDRPQPKVLATNAADLSSIESGSVELVCIDPPYYDNVMYAELADFFYVWEKRTLGLLHPDLFTTELCDKQNEAVANPARFAEFGSRREELAASDYRAKMAAIFAECGRILRDDGVMTVMFTHKKAEAWDTLGMALMESGFTIETSWPVETEPDVSLHQAKKNAAKATIVLVCRKRAQRSEGESHPYFEDLEGEVRTAAREALERFSAAGIEGVDLLLSTYGPALSVISSVWPVYSSEADESGRSRLLRPEEALAAAREEAVGLRRRRLVGAEAHLDPLSDFVLIAWDAFRAAEFPFDDARRLALAVGGLEVDELVRAKLLARKSGTVELLPPARRVRRSGDDTLPGVRPAATEFGCAIDAVHTVMHVADVDGMVAAKALVDRAGLARDSAFLACVQGLVNSIPRTKEKGAWVRPEAETLDRLCAGFFPDIEIPPDPVADLDVEQTALEVGA